jgi:class 3 adenylate cyclase/tetratricopeptide (TPR) repeat protein
MRDIGTPELESNRLTRRATAVAFLDVAGYARLTERDEEGTVRRWTALRRGVIEPMVDAWRGRVVDRAGDGLLLAFASADDAITWAATLQTALADHPQAITLRVRIAVHFGEVLEGAEGDIHGADIHTAQRLQSYAEPGGIVVSQAAADRATSPLPGTILALGALHLRHISEPVQAFSVRLAADTPALPMALGNRAERRASIAVLPFQQADDGPYAAAITEGLVHVLSGLEGLVVISRGSTEAYGPLASPVKVGTDLAVRYVLSGSVRRAADRLRIGTELTDAQTGELIRTDRYDGTASDIFALQDRISTEIATTLAPELRQREISRAMRRHPDNVDAYELVLQAIGLLQRLDAPSFSTARLLLTQAMEEDSGYAPAHTYAAWWHVVRIAMGWSPSVDADAEAAREAATAAIQRNAGDALALAIHGYVVGYTRRDFATATQLLARAMSAGPNCAPAWAFSGLIAGWRGDAATAVAHCLHGVRLAPYDPIGFFYQHFLSQAYYIAGDHESAVTWGLRASTLNPRHVTSLRVVVVALAALGRLDEAREVAQRLREMDPGFTIERFITRTPLRGALLDHFVTHLRAAGF